MIRRLRATTILFLMTGFLGSLMASWEFLDMPTDRGFGAICAIDEQNIFVVGHQGLWKTFDGDSTWAIDSHSVLGTWAIWEISFIGDATGFLALSDTTDMGGIRRSTDGGQTWDNVSFDTLDIAIAFSDLSFPGDQGLIGYAATERRLFKTIDGGNNWKWVSTIPKVPGYEQQEYRDVCFPTPDTGYLIGVFREETHADYSYFKTTDGGNTWVLNEEVLADPTFVPVNFSFPENPYVGYMTGGGKVYKTTDGGATWDTVLKASENPNIHDICFPETDQVGYVLNDTMVHRTIDGGASWQTFGLGQDTVFARCHFLNNWVGFISGTGTTAAGFLYTPGFVLKTTDGLLGIAEEDWVDVELASLEIFSPTLFNQKLVLRYQAKAPGSLKVSCFDASGRRILPVYHRNVGCGDGSLSLNTSRFPAGVYFIRAEFASAQGNQNQILRTVKVR